MRPIEELPREADLALYGANGAGANSDVSGDAPAMPAKETARLR